jgi:hypothetical protein
MAKYEQISDLLKKRIAHGDYALKSLPAERQLALEVGVSYMTARRALQHLFEEGFLVRGPNGRPEIRRAGATQEHPLQIAFLAPSFHSHAINQWRLDLDRATAQLSGKVRQVPYVHWDDPIIMDALEGFDGVFLLPSTEPMPPQIAERLSKSKCPLVVLDNDMSHAGIPSIRMFPPVVVQRLLDHLESLGHNSIACLNVQPHDAIIEPWIEQWKIWMAAHHFSGQLIDEPVESYGEPFSRAYGVMQRLIAAEWFDAGALLCLTPPAAIGAMRAMHEAGLRPGEDVAVCTINGGTLAAFHIPSLTALEEPDTTPYLFTCLRWMSRGGGPWQGPLLLQPSEVPLAVRESTSAPAGEVITTSSSNQFVAMTNKESHHAHRLAR